MRRRALFRTGIVGLVTLFGLLLVHAAIYAIVTGRIESEIPAFIDEAATHGWWIEAGPPTRTGWPWAAKVRMSHLVVENSKTGDGMRWTSAWIDIGTRLDSLRTLRIMPGGEQTIAVHPYALVPFRPGQTALSLPLYNPGPMMLEIDGLSVPLAAGELRLVHATARLEAAALDVSIADAQIDPPLPAPFAGSGTASLTAVLNEVSGAERGVALSALALDWGALHVTGSGAGKLDARGEPEGRASLRVRGATEVLEAAVRSGMIAASPAAAARAVVQLLTLAAAGGPVTLPVGLSDRILTVAQFPLLRLRPGEKP